MYLDGAHVVATLRLFPRPTRWRTLVHLSVMCLACGLSSLSTAVSYLIATQGVPCGLGGSLSYCPCMAYMDGWFTRREGLAYGIMWLATGFPLVLGHLFHTYGFRTTLCVWVGIVFVMSAPLTYCTKPHLPIASTAHRRRPNLRFLLSRPFELQSASIIESSGFFLSNIYLPS